MFDIRLFGETDIVFDERLGHPEDTQGRMLRAAGGIWINQIKYAPDGSDAWYSVTINIDWHSNRTSGWVRAGDLNALPMEFVQHNRPPYMPPKPRFSQQEADAALEAEVRVSTPDYRAENTRKYLAFNGHPRIQKPGQLCEAEREDGRSDAIPLRAGPSAESALQGFLRDSSFVLLGQHTADGWWQVTVHLKDGSYRKGFITDWLIDDCDAGTPYARAKTFELVSPVG